MFTITKDHFDSKILDLEVAKVLLDEGKIQEALEMFAPSDFVKLFRKIKKNLLKENFDYATLRFPLKYSEILFASHKAGFSIADISVMLSQNLSRKNSTHEKAHKDVLENHERFVREARKDDAKHVSHISQGIFIHNRLYKDPLIPDKTAFKFYREWAKNCVLGKAATKTYVYENTEGKVVGFIGLKKNGHVALIGVSKDVHGKGIGEALVRNGVEFFKKNGLEEIYIDTQAINIPAFRLYEKCGYRLHETFATIRWSNLQ